MNALISSKLQHLPNLGRRTDQAAANLDLLDDQSESHELRDRVLGSADLNELAADVEEAEVFVDGEAGAGDGRDDQVEAVGVLLLVAFLRGGDEVVLGLVSDGVSIGVANYGLTAPSFRASSRFALVREMATTLSAPRALAKRRPKCPSYGKCQSHKQSKRFKLNLHHQYQRYQHACQDRNRSA